MKFLTVSATQARSELKKLDAEPKSGLTLSAFPKVVGDDYIPVWSEFIKSRAVKELYTLFKKHGAPVAQMFVCQAFISHLHTVSTTFLVKPYQVSKANALIIAKSVVQTKPLLKADLSKLTFDKHLTISKVEVEIIGEDDKYLNGNIEPEVVLFLSLIPKRKRKVSMHEGRYKNMENSIDNILYSLGGYLYKGTKPPRTLLGKKGVGNRQTYMSVPKAKLARPLQWEYLKKTSLGIDLIRADRNILLAKVRFPMSTCLFYGTDKPKKVMDALQKSIINNIGV